jgi:hypothetical protein
MKHVMGPRLRLALLLALAPACVHHWDLGARSPGDVDVAKPPDDLTRRAVDPGQDPGEGWFVIRPGPFFSAIASRGGGTTRFAANTGFELSLTGGTSERTHDHPREVDFFGQGRNLTLAVNLGASRASRDARGQARSAAYAEVQASRGLLGSAAGWSWASRGQRGPQLTGFFGPLYLRATHYLRHQTTFELGLIFKAELAWAWSR